MIYSPILMPEHWKIQVQGENADGETTTDWWSVSEAEYNNIKIGDYVRRG